MISSLSQRPQHHTPAFTGRPSSERNPLADRTGYDEDFLDIKLPLPKLDPSVADLAAPLLSDPSKSELEYTHFSVVMNKERRAPFFTAANVDGSQYNPVPRDGKWDFDPRISSAHQLGGEAYSSNAFDRGHMVRRRDPMWGPDAHKASNDTFYYTNAALQHGSLNQKKWLDLENHVLSQATEFDRKITVFTGPVLQDSDPSFNNNGAMSTPTKIPMKFWKVMVWNEPGQGLKSESFVMSQEPFVKKGQSKGGSSQEHVDDFSQYRIPLEQLEDLTKLDFGNLIDSPTTSTPVANYWNLGS